MRSSDRWANTICISQPYWILIPSATYEHFMEALFGLFVLSYLTSLNARMEGKSATGELGMWIKAMGPESVAELFHNYEIALGICGKGSESGSSNESEQSQSSMHRGEDSGSQCGESRPKSGSH
jgi:hypothetical protein